MHERRAGESPVGDVSAGFLLHIFGPHNFAGRSLKTEGIAPTAKDVDTVAIDGGCACGAALEIFISQLGGVGMFPHHFPRRRFETINRILACSVTEREGSTLGN